MPRPRRPQQQEEDDEQGGAECCRCEGCELRATPAARPDAGAAVLSALSAAAIRQEHGLPRCLVLLGTGLLEELEEMQREHEEHEEEEEEEEDEGKAAATAAERPGPGGRRRWPPLPHLDRVAREGMLTPLQLRDLSGLAGGEQQQQQQQEEEGAEAAASSMAAQQFWGAVPPPPPASLTPIQQQQQLAARFKGLRAIVLSASSSSSSSSAAASAVGAAVRPLEMTSSPEHAAELALGALGMDALPLGDGEAELVVLHVDASDAADAWPADEDGRKEEEAEEEERRGLVGRRRRRSLVRWLDHAARAVFQVGGEAARDALLLVVVMTARGLEKEEEELLPGLAVVSGAHRDFGGDDDDDNDGGGSSDPPDLPRPLQSGQMLGGARVPLLRWWRRGTAGGGGANAAASTAPAPTPAAVCARRLPGAVRACGARRLALREAVHSGEGAVLMERLLPELAYKLGRAAKYGA
jgi:hypothetical protein